MDGDLDCYDYHPDNKEEGSECVGSCDQCDCNLYEDDCYTHGNDELCGQCYWWRTMA